MTKSSGILALVLLLMAAVPAHAQKNKLADGRALLRAMRERYDGNWFRTAVFLQDNTLYGPDGKVSGHSQWDHHMQFPGKLRIDFVPVSDGNGVLLANDSQYVFQGGKMVGKRPRTLSLLVVAFDVYAQPAEKSIAQMEQLKFDLSQIRSDRWQNREVYVVGAREGDLASPQFWVDQDHLYTVRVIEPEIGAGDTVHVRDTRFGKYRKFGKGWIAPEVMMYQDGKPSRLEEYRDPKADVEIDPAVFDPMHWKDSRK